MVGGVQMHPELIPRNSLYWTEIHLPSLTLI